MHKAIYIFLFAISLEVGAIKVAPSMLTQFYTKPNGPSKLISFGELVDKTTQQEIMKKLSGMPFLFVNLILMNELDDNYVNNTKYDLSKFHTDLMSLLGPQQNSPYVLRDNEMFIYFGLSKKGYKYECGALARTILSENKMKEIVKTIGPMLTPGNTSLAFNTFVDHLVLLYNDESARKKDIKVEASKLITITQKNTADQANVNVRLMNQNPQVNVNLNAVQPQVLQNQQSGFILDQNMLNQGFSTQNLNQNAGLKNQVPTNKIVIQQTQQNIPLQNLGQNFASLARNQQQPTSLQHNDRQFTAGLNQHQQQPATLKYNGGQFTTGLNQHQQQQATGLITNPNQLNGGLNQQQPSLFTNDQRGNIGGFVQQQPTFFTTPQNTNMGGFNLQQQPSTFVSNQNIPSSNFNQQQQQLPLLNTKKLEFEGLKTLKGPTILDNKQVLSIQRGPQLQQANTLLIDQKPQYTFAPQQQQYDNQFMNKPSQLAAAAQKQNPKTIVADVHISKIVPQQQNFNVIVDEPKTRTIIHNDKGVNVVIGNRQNRPNTHPQTLHVLNPPNNSQQAAQKTIIYTGLADRSQPYPENAKPTRIVFSEDTKPIIVKNNNYGFARSSVVAAIVVALIVVGFLVVIAILRS